MIVKLTDRKAEKILKHCIHFCHQGKAFTIREVASLIGSLISSCPGVRYGRLHYRNIERDKINALKSQKGNFEAKMSLSHESPHKMLSFNIEIYSMVPQTRFFLQMHPN